MSEDLGASSGEECALRIDTEQRKNNMDRPNKGKGGGKAGAGGRGRGRARGKGNNAQQQQDSFKAGDVVWAKVMGFNFWPAKIFDAEDDAVVPVWLKMPPKPAYLLVRFFGTYDMQWVSPSSIETYDRGLGKKFHSKSRSKIFQKAVKEVFAYMKDFVMPDGLTVKPPDPPMVSGEENEGIATNKKAPASSSVYVVRCGDSAAPNGSTHSKGSSRRKSSTPRRRLSSSSSDSLAKRPRLHSEGEGQEEEGKGPPLSPEIQAFTCAPLPAIVPSAEPAK